MVTVRSVDGSLLDRLTQERMNNMKYINAEKLKELIDEKWRELADKNVKVGGGKWDAEISTYLSVLRLIDSLQQEQQTGEEYAIEIGKHTHILRVGSQSDIDNLIRQEKQEQPEADLDDTIRVEFGTRAKVEDGKRCVKLNLDKFSVLARHFYELGLKARNNK